MKRSRLKLKRKRLSLKNRKSSDQLITSAESPEEQALVKLLKEHECDIWNETNIWLDINRYIPPNTDSSIVIHDKITGSNTIYPAHVFLKHYLIDRFHYRFEGRPLFKGISHFMILGEP